MPDQRLLPRHPILKKYGNHRKQPLAWLSPWTKCYAAENTKPNQQLGNKLSAGICNGPSCQDGGVTLYLWMRGSYSISPGIPLSCYKLYLLKCTMPGLEHIPLKEVEKCGYWSSVSCPQAISHLRVLLSLANMYALYNQVNFLKMPASLSSSPGGNILFFIVWSFGHHICFFRWPREQQYT